MKKTALLSFCVFLSGALFCQQYVTEATASKKAVKYLNDGVNYAMQRQLEASVTAFQEAIREEPNFITAWLYLGDSYKNLKRDSLAVEAYTKAIDMGPDHDVWVYSKLTDVEMSMGLYEEAYEHLSIFLENPAVTGEPRKKAERTMVNLEFAKKAYLNPVEFDPIDMGDEINSSDPEYFPSLSVDGSIMVVTRRIKDSVQLGPSSYRRFDNEDFYISYFENGVWTEAANMGNPVNSKLNEGAQSISADGRYLFYTMCDHPLGRGSCDLYYSIRIGDQWTNPENCGKVINSGDWESQPSISADGNYLFFSSAKPGSIGSYDIWMAKRAEDGWWEAPENLGPTINTKYSEQSPFIHPDGKTLYFSSDGHPGMGLSDLFYSQMDENGAWSEPVNLGYPINTNNQEMGLSVSADGKTAYYGTDREKKQGEFDIYSFQLPDKVQADPVSYVKAIVTDAETGKPLLSTVQLFDIEKSTTISNSKSDPKNGEFLVVLPIGKDYGLLVQKEGYLFHSENFSLRDALPDKPYIINVKLQPIKAGEMITLRNIFFETGSAELMSESQTELMKVVEMMQKNPGMHIRVNGHTDNIGSEDDNMRLSLNRSLSVKNFLAQNGIEETRMTHKGFGESKPIGSNDSEQGRANNRRTEIEIMSLE